MPPALKILFVDDEPDLAPLIRQKFRRHVREGSIELAFASDGVEALDALAADPAIEIVVTDINMPRMDGLTLLARLREGGHRHKAVVVTAYGDMENIRTAMNRGAFDFLTKPIDLADLEITLDQARAAVEQEREADRVRAAFGRYLSDDIARALLDHPEALTLGGERREVTILMSDLSGFSAHAEAMEPERVVDLLNVYLGAMTDVIDAHGGTIDEFIGDAVLAIFGAPFAVPDHARRAVACALDMQRAMASVNAEMTRRGLPALDMVVAVNTGEVIVGNIGSAKRTKYGVVGSPVNLTSRIQTVAAPGEVLVSEATRRAAGLPRPPGGDGAAPQGDAFCVLGSREATVKGFAEPVLVHALGAPGEPSPEGPEKAPDGFRPLAEPLPFAFAVLDGKRVTGEEACGEVVELSAAGALARTGAAVPESADLRLRLSGVDEHVYARVVGAAEGGALRLRFASLPAAADAALRRLATR